MKCQSPARSLSLLTAIGLFLTLLALALLCLGWQATPAYAATITVDASSGSDIPACCTTGACLTIQYALNTCAGSGDVVHVKPGTYNENFDMAAGVVISGSNATTTIVNGDGTRSVVRAIGGSITSSAILRGLTIQGGSATTGGGVLVVNGASPTLEDCIVRNNAATDGGGLYLTNNSSSAIKDCIVRDNTATNHGGGLYITGGAAPTIEGCTMRENDATRHGGGLYANARVVLSNTNVLSNTAGRDGGGINAGNTLLTDTQVVSNTAGTNGGGLAQRDPVGQARVTGGLFERNRALGTTGRGGGLYVSGSAILNGTQVFANAASGSQGYGGGLWASYAYLTATEFTGNVTGQRGGALCVEQHVEMTRSQVIGNIAVSAGRGGGLYAEREAEVVNSLFAGNGSQAGSGLYLAGADSAQSTLRHLTVVSATVSSPYPTAAAILIRNSGTVYITNTIVANYPYGVEQLQTSSVYEDYNLYFGNSTANFKYDNLSNVHFGTHSLFGKDPSFVDAAAGDYHLKTYSAAMDAGAFLGTTDDLDGNSRPDATSPFEAPDIGCYENKSLSVCRPVTDTMTFGAARARILFTDDGGLDFITITVKPGEFPTSDPSDLVVSRTVWITTSSSVSVNATLVLGYEDGEVKSGLSESDLQLFRWTGSQWKGHTSTVDQVNNVVTGTGVTDFSPWTMGDDGSVPTGVDLVSFTATSGDQNIYLEWETATESDNLGFHLYRADAPAGNALRLNDALIPSQNPGDPGGAHYDYVDQTTTQGVTYYYWLESVDVYGATTRYGPANATTGIYRIYLPQIEK